MARLYFIYKKITQTKEVLDQIVNHTKTDTPLQQMLTHFHLRKSSENHLFKNRDIYNE